MRWSCSRKPGPGERARLSAALRGQPPRGITSKATAIRATLRAPQLGQPPVLTAAHATTARALLTVITAVSEQVRALEGQVAAPFWPPPGR